MRAAAAAVLAALVLTPLAAGSPQSKPMQCFFLSQFVSWRAPDARTMYISVRPRQVFKLDLSYCPTLQQPNARLITFFHSDSICDALDWDLKVAAWSGGPAIPCIVKSMTRLTPAEAEAIPPKFMPSF